MQAGERSEPDCIQVPIIKKIGCSTLMKEGERSEPSFNKVPNLIFLSFGYHVILIKVNTPPRGEATGKRSLLVMKLGMIGKEWG